jgi:predicted RNase H-like HicB family nuclease
MKCRRIRRFASPGWSVGMRYTVVLEESDEGFAASVPSLPGCHSQGVTEQEALESIADAIREYLAAIRDRVRNANTHDG